MFNLFSKSAIKSKVLTRWHLVNIEKEYTGDITWNYADSNGRIYGSLSANKSVSWLWRYADGHYQYGVSYSTMEECLEAIAISVEKRNSDSDKAKTHSLNQIEAVDEQFTNFMSRKHNVPE